MKSLGLCAGSKYCAIAVVGHSKGKYQSLDSRVISSPNAYVDWGQILDYYRAEYDSFLSTSTALNNVCCGATWTMPFKPFDQSRKQAIWIESILIALSYRRLSIDAIPMQKNSVFSGQKLKKVGLVALADVGALFGETDERKQKAYSVAIASQFL